jgi:hypothetical protein
MEEIKPIVDAAIEAANTGEAVVRKAWSLMEAATEKQRASELLSQGAVQRIQGKHTGGD